MTAYHEGGHALVAYYTPGADPLHKATILPRGRSLGATFQLPENDQYSVNRQQVCVTTPRATGCFASPMLCAQLIARIATAMGGRAAEDIIYGRDGVSTGASNDFQVRKRRRNTAFAVALTTDWLYLRDRWRHDWQPTWCRDGA